MPFNNAALLLSYQFMKVILAISLGMEKPLIQFRYVALLSHLESYFTAETLKAF
jgi:hypothetical protein